MSRPSRLRAAFLALALLIASVAGGGASSAQSPRWGDITGPVTATSFGVRIPTTLAEVATLTAEDRERMDASVRAQLRQLRALVEAGEIKPQTVVGHARPRVAVGGGKLLAPLRSHLFLDARCYLAWQPYPFTGTAVWAGASTQSTATTYLYADGRLYKNGNQVDRYAIYHTSTIADVRSGDHWLPWWEGATFAHQSQHGIYYPGTNTHDWGPWTCGVTQTF